MGKPYHHGALREALLDAAERVLKRDGVGAMTLRAVAREAGVSHGSPSHHFPAYEDLLSEAAAVGFERLMCRMAAEVKSAVGGKETRLSAIGHGYVSFARENSALFLLMFRSGQLNDRNAKLASAREAAFGLLAGESTERTDLVQAAGHWSVVHGLAMLAIDGRLRPLGARAALSQDQLIDAVLHDDGVPVPRRQTSVVASSRRTRTKPQG